MVVEDVVVDVLVDDDEATVAPDLAIVVDVVEPDRPAG